MFIYIFIVLVPASKDLLDLSAGSTAGGMDLVFIILWFYFNRVYCML